MTTRKDSRADTLMAAIDLTLAIGIGEGDSVALVFLQQWCEGDPESMERLRKWRREEQLRLMRSELNYLCNLYVHANGLRAWFLKIRIMRLTLEVSGYDG